MRELRKKANIEKKALQQLMDDDGGNGDVK